MKKQIFTLFSILTLTAAYSQVSTNWTTNGDSVNTGSFIGTTNQEPLLLMSNSQLGIKINPNGDVLFKPLDLGSPMQPNGLILSDGIGKISRFNFSGNSSHILLGDGTWGDLSSIAPNLWGANGNNIFYNNGNVGIGTQYPAYMLDVIGDARVANNLYVGNGIVIGDRIRANSEVKTITLNADSIVMDSTRAIYGKTVVEGDVKLKYNLSVNGSASVLGDLVVQGNQSILGDQFMQGTMDFNGDLIARQGLTFDGASGIKFVPIGTNGGGSFRYGNNEIFQPLAIPCSAGPTSDITHQFGGIIQVFDPANPTTSGLLNLQTWTGGSSIDASVGGHLGGGGLLLNYFCGNNTFINTNNGLPDRGGNIYMGEKVGMARYVGIGYNGSSIDNFDNTTALNIYSNENAQTAVKINTYNGTVTPINVVHPDGTEFFKVSYDGAIKSHHLANGGVRSILVDNDGNLIWGQPSSTSAIAWQLGGNSLTNPTSEYLGSQNSDLFIAAGGQPKMVVKAGGNIGVASSQPYKQFTVNGDVSLANNESRNGFDGLEILGNDQVPTRRGISLEPDPNGDFNFFINNNQSGGSAEFHFKNGANPDFSNATSAAAARNLMSLSSGGAMTLFGNGNVSPMTIKNTSLTGAQNVFEVLNNGTTHIGIDLPIASTSHQNAMLTVGGNGVIACKELYVIKPTNWADFVFDKNYKLLPLDEVEKYYSDNKHLPGVPSEAEVDASGINAAEMDATLLKKIEELTIYVVELKKEIEQLKAERK